MKFGPLCFAVLFGWLTYYFFIMLPKVCSMRNYLWPLLDRFEATLLEADIECNVAYGTLLGLIRDENILNHDFDIDYDVRDPLALYALKALFLQKFNYRLYNETDWIFQKGWTMLYQGSWDAYLTTGPCLRLYDETRWYYIDIYCDRVVTWANTTFFCNNEKDRGQCRPLDWVLPVNRIHRNGRLVSLPSQPMKILDQMYGPRWRYSVEPKGVKKVLCSKWGPFLCYFLSAVSALFFLHIFFQCEKKKCFKSLPISEFIWPVTACRAFLIF
jgi:hypothetical protein